MGYRKSYYRKDGTYVQGHFANTRSRSYSNKNKGCMLLLLITMTLGLGISCSNSDASNSNCPTKTCGDFATRSQAQAAFDSNKKCYKNLDADGDGIACENLK